MGRPRIPLVDVYARTDVYQGRVYVHLLFPNDPSTSDSSYHSWSPQGGFRALPVALAKNTFQEATPGEAEAVMRKYNDRVKRTKFTLLKLKGTKGAAIAADKEENDDV